MTFFIYFGLEFIFSLSTQLVLVALKLWLVSVSLEGIYLPKAWAFSFLYLDLSAPW